MRMVLEVLGWLTAIFIFALAGHAVLAQAHVSGARDARAALVAVEAGGAASASQEDREESPAPGARQRRRLAHGDEERREDREKLTPASLMRAARTIYISPSKHLDKKYLEYKLQKRHELADWNLMLVADEEAADLVVTFDKTALNYIFHITDAQSGIIITSGKTVAINKLVAAENLGGEIIRKMRDVRAGR